MFQEGMGELPKRYPFGSIRQCVTHLTYGYRDAQGQGGNVWWHNRVVPEAFVSVSPGAYVVEKVCECGECP